MHTGNEMDTHAKVDAVEVLLVDDDPDLANMVATVLAHDRTQVFRTRTASTIEEGLAAWDDRPADVVLLDLGLPDAPRADPLAALRRLLACHPRPCVVVLTAHPWGLGREAVRMGAEDYVDKSDLTLSVLRDTLLYAFERHAHSIRSGADNVAAGAHTPTRGPAFGAERLRGPLGLLVQNLEGLRNARLSDEERTALVDQALRTAYAMGGQLDQVVAAQRRVESREAVDLAGLAESVAADLAGLADAIHARITIGTLPRIWGQREPLRLLLRNLVLNALQHTRPGVHIEICAVDHPLGIRLLVEDDGPGIPAERRGALFDPRADDDSLAHDAFRKYGLRACSAVATAHGGRCWVEDRDGAGTRVVVELPVRRRPG